MNNGITSCFVALAASAIPAQQYTETFTLPNGPTIPGWTAHNNGNWSIVNGRLTKSGGGSPDFLTKDGFTALNSVLDLEVFYGSVPGVQHGALTSRHPGTSALTPILYAKIQDNAAPLTWIASTSTRTPRPSPWRSRPRPRARSSG